jgi:hypothetical protein
VEFSKEKKEGAFVLGLDDWAVAAERAKGCRAFRSDVEEEWVADEAVSCYNCRYRRWQAASIACLANPL